MCLRILFSQVTEERGKIDTDIFLIYWANGQIFNCREIYSKKNLCSYLVIVHLNGADEKICGGLELTKN